MDSVSGTAPPDDNTVLTLAAFKKFWTTKLHGGGRDGCGGLTAKANPS